MSEAENMHLWKLLKSVPDEHLKDYKRTGGFAGTGIRPQWRLQRMTEVFGPVGKGWGYEVVKLWREGWGAVSEAYPQGPCVCTYAQVNVWYMIGDEKCWTGDQVGGTVVGEKTPDEAYKMSITDGLGKCMASIGVAADIYLDADAEDPSDKYLQHRERGPDPRDTAAYDRGLPPKQPIPGSGSVPANQAPANNPAPQHQAPQSSPAPQNQPAPSNSTPSGNACPKGHTRTKVQAGGKELVCFECKTTFPVVNGSPAATPTTTTEPAQRQNSEPRF